MAEEPKWGTSLQRLWSLLQATQRELYIKLVAGVLDEPFSQLTPPSGVAYRPASLRRLEPCPSYVAWRAGMATPLSGLS